MKKTFFEMTLNEDFQVEIVKHDEDGFDKIPPNGGFSEPVKNEKGLWTAVCLPELEPMIRSDLLFKKFGELSQVTDREQFLKLWDIIDKSTGSKDSLLWTLLEWDTKTLWFIEKDITVSNCVGTSADGAVWMDGNGVLRGVCSGLRKQACQNKILSCVLKQIFDKAGVDAEKMFLNIYLSYIPPHLGPYKKTEIKELDDILGKS